jgi:exosortase A
VGTKSRKPIAQTIDLSVKTVWRNRALSAAYFTVLVLVVYYKTTWSMISTWWNLQTFAHGFLILPITLWMIWERRARLLEVTPWASPWALILVAGAGLCWFAGSLANAQVVQQFSLIGLIISGIWAILGTQSVKRLIFPLAFLFFAVPVGEDFVPPLMEFTASFTVELIKLTGIPVYREGLYFSLPSGNWSVVKACSGIRYLIASVTLGCLFAYLTYQSIAKRVVFIAFSIVVPIIANGVRAYIIVMLGHLSNMTIATGVDHLIYGWLFFGLVMLLLFWIGGKFKDPDPGPDASLVTKVRHDSTGFESGRQNAILGFTILIVCIFPVLGIALDSRDIPIAHGALSVAGIDSRWQESHEPYWSWAPSMYGADKTTHQYYRGGERLFGLSIGQYLDQRQGVEMVSYRNRVLDKQLKEWNQVSQKGATVKLQGRNFNVIKTVLSGEGRRLLVYSWYRVGDHYATNSYIAKLYEILEAVTFSDSGSAKIVIAVSTEQGDEQAEQELNQFLAAALPEIELALDAMVEPTK